MGDVLTFAPRPRAAAPQPAEPLSASDLRSRLEEAAQTALDAADKIIAALDHIDGDADLEPDADAEPSLAAPEGQMSQVGWARGGDEDREAEVPEVALPDVAVLPPAEPEHEVINVAPLRWGGRGNVIAAAGVALVDLVAR